MSHLFGGMKTAMKRIVSNLYAKSRIENYFSMYDVIFVTIVFYVY